MPPAEANQRSAAVPVGRERDVDLARDPADRDRPRLGRIGRQPEAAREVVAGADRHDAEREPGARFEDPVDDLLDRAVAPDSHDPIAAALRGPRRELLRLATSNRHVELCIGTKRQSLADPRDELRGAPRSRGRVDDDHGGVRHATDCAVGVKPMETVG